MAEPTCSCGQPVTEHTARQLSRHGRTIRLLTPSADVPACRDEDPVWQSGLAACYPPDYQHPEDGPDPGWPPMSSEDM